MRSIEKLTTKYYYEKVRPRLSPRKKSLLAIDIVKNVILFWGCREPEMYAPTFAALTAAAANDYSSYWARRRSKETLMDLGQYLARRQASAVEYACLDLVRTLTQTGRLAMCELIRLLTQVDMPRDPRRLVNLVIQHHIGPDNSFCRSLIDADDRPLVALSSFSPCVFDLAEKARAGDVAALGEMEEALSDCGQEEMAAHFHEKSVAHPVGCYAFDLILGGW